MRLLGTHSLVFYCHIKKAEVLAVFLEIRHQESRWIHKRKEYLQEGEHTGVTLVKNTSACFSCHSHLAGWETTQRLPVSCTESDSKYLSGFSKTINITH